MIFPRSLVSLFLQVVVWLVGLPLLLSGAPSSARLRDVSLFAHSRHCRVFSAVDCRQRYVHLSISGFLALFSSPFVFTVDVLFADLLPAAYSLFLPHAFYALGHSPTLSAIPW